MEEEKLLAWSVATASCLCLCPPVRGEVSCIICVPSSAQTSLEVGHISSEKASAATEYYAMYWVSSYGDKVDFNLGVCRGNLLNSTHFYWQVATNNPSKSDPIKFSFIKLFSCFLISKSFYLTLAAVACRRTNLVSKIILVEGRQIWILLHLIFGRNFIAEVKYHFGKWQNSLENFYFIEIYNLTENARWEHLIHSV